METMGRRAAMIGKRSTARWLPIKGFREAIGSPLAKK